MIFLNFSYVDIFSTVRAMETFHYDYSIVDPELNNGSQHAYNTLDFLSNRKEKKYTSLSLVAPKETYEYLYNKLLNPKNHYNMIGNDFFMICYLRNVLTEEQLDKAILIQQNHNKEKAIEEYKKIEYQDEKYKFKDLNETNWLTTLQQQIENTIDNRLENVYIPLKDKKVMLSFEKEVVKNGIYNYKNVILFEFDTYRLISFSKKISLNCDIISYMKEEFKKTTFLINDINQKDSNNILFILEENKLMESINKYCDLITSDPRLNISSMSFCRTLNVKENKMMFAVKCLQIKEDIYQRPNKKEIIINKYLNKIKNIGEIEILNIENENKKSLISLSIKLKSAERINLICNKYQIINKFNVGKTYITNSDTKIFNKEFSEGTIFKVLDDNGLIYFKDGILIDKGCGNCCESNELPVVNIEMKFNIENPNTKEEKFTDCSEYTI